VVRVARARQGRRASPIRRAECPGARRRAALGTSQTSPTPGTSNWIAAASGSLGRCRAEAGAGQAQVQEQAPVGVLVQAPEPIPSAPPLRRAASQAPPLFILDHLQVGVLEFWSQTPYWCSYARARACSDKPGNNSKTPKLHGSLHSLSSLRHLSPVVRKASPRTQTTL
jgi:hypothetical protein